MGKHENTDSTLAGTPTKWLPYLFDFSLLLRFSHLPRLGLVTSTFLTAILANKAIECSTSTNNGDPCSLSTDFSTFLEIPTKFSGKPLLLHLEMDRLSRARKQGPFSPHHPRGAPKVANMICNGKVRKFEASTQQRG